MLKIRYSSRFKKDFKTVVKRGYDIHLLEEVLNILVQENPLPQKYSNPHFHCISMQFIFPQTKVYWFDNIVGR